MSSIIDHYCPHILITTGIWKRAAAEEDHDHAHSEPENQADVSYHSNVRNYAVMNTFTSTCCVHGMLMYWDTPEFRQSTYMY